ncbi:hypothetical protein HS088_TW15G00551 [Tripterygium wilfordii]|uniref:Uncharacterized protein n=1 Tax=Tripterygium wilfordii TaxID=458696 RepID=A0A7J7CLV7_TRIWF|nr:hypothetical protein HS088_TW15G00551 [Tripterygium wilfordii]
MTINLADMPLEQCLEADMLMGVLTNNTVSVQDLFGEQWLKLTDFRAKFLFSVGPQIGCLPRNVFLGSLARVFFLRCKFAISSPINSYAGKWVFPLLHLTSVCCCHP